MSGSPGQPVIIEAAINGGNPAAPRSPDEIAECATACIDGGAAIVHNHIDLFGPADEAAARYREGWDPVLAAHPDALLYPTINGAGDVQDRVGHLESLAATGGLLFGLIEPGSVNLGPRFAYMNSGADITYHADLCERLGLMPTLAIFEPGWLRAALSLWRAGRLPAGTMLRLYFGGDYVEADGGFWFGLPPSEVSLDAYLAMLDGCPLPWSVAVLGGDLFESELPRLALERGGHLRVGLEDFAGPELPSNEELVAQAVKAAEQVGRPVASPADTARMLGLAPVGGT